MEAIYLKRSDTDRWLNQFDVSDQADAEMLLSLVKFVSSDALRSEFINLLEDRLADGATPIGLFNETERRMWRGKPNRLFKEKKRAHPVKIGKKVTRAYEKCGPRPVPRHHNVNPQIGSEGIMANILTQFQKKHPGSSIINPGPERFRQDRIRRFILITDFIGSGERVEKNLNSAWRVNSVRSWWSRRERNGLHFEVVAYAATKEGVARIERHPCKPKVFFATACPTIWTLFMPSQAEIMVDLCSRYPPSGSQSLGFGDTGALLAFAHGIPNNAPRMFWKSSPKWQALFPRRAVISGSSPFDIDISQEKNRLSLAAKTAVAGHTISPVDIETIVLSALRRSPRNAEAISERLGLELTKVRDTLQKLCVQGWINQHYQLTERGRLIVRRLAKVERKIVLPESPEQPYFPKSLRMPRHF